MLSKIPWDIIGPVVTAVIFILMIVFGFMLKWKKLEKTTSRLPKDINSTGKKTLCFTHEGKIAANETAIEMIGEQLKISNENNRQDHGRMFKKFEDLGEKIITEIHRANGDT